MFKDLIYDGVVYSNFEIDERGNIQNKITGTVYKKTVTNKGYYNVSLPMGKRGKSKCLRLHKALAETFIPNPNGYNIVNHKDENKLNFALSNLEWCTSKMNTNTYIANHPMSNNRKLTKTDVEYIRSHLDISCVKLARMFNVSKATILNVKHNTYYIGV